MWKYIADGSPMGEATELALVVALSILVVGGLLSLGDIRTRSRAFHRSDFEGSVGPDRDAV